MMRLFVAVQLAAELQKKIAAFIGQNAPNAHGVKWIDSSQAHFTLFFLGEQPERLVRDLDPFFKTIAAKQQSFALSLGQGGVFPSWKAPRVLWLGVDQGQEHLGRLAAAITEACVRCGLPKPDRPFAPHLTVGRVKTPSPTLNRAALMQGVTGEMVVDSFTLYASILRPQGPLYREIATYRLTKEQYNE